GDRRWGGVLRGRGRGAGAHPGAGGAGVRALLPRRPVPRAGQPGRQRARARHRRIPGEGARRDGERAVRAGEGGRVPVHHPARVRPGRARTGCLTRRRSRRVTAGQPAPGKPSSGKPPDVVPSDSSTRSPSASPETICTYRSPRTPITTVRVARCSPFTTVTCALSPVTFRTACDGR